MISLYCWEKRVISGCSAKDVSRGREQNISPAGMGTRKVICTCKGAVQRGQWGHSAPNPKGNDCESPAWLRVQFHILRLWSYSSSPQVQGGSWLDTFWSIWREPREALLQPPVLWDWSCHGGEGQRRKGAAKRNVPLVSSSLLGSVCDRDQRAEGRGAGWRYWKPAFGFGIRSPKDTLGHWISREEHVS